MPRAGAHALPSICLHSSHPSNPSPVSYKSSGARAAWIAIRAAILLALLCVCSGYAWAAIAATTTTLTTSSKTVNGRVVTVLSAKVTDPNAVSQGLVKFYDGKTLVGTGQIVNTGTKYTHGAAYLAVELSAGSHALKAVFAGTATDTSSASAVKTVTVTGGTSATTISSTGTAGNYTLTAQVVGNGMTAPTGQVAFVDQTNGNSVMGSTALGAGTAASTFAKATSYDIYDKADQYHPQQVVVADLNGDGILDFAELDYSASMSIHLGKGDGTFLAAAPSCTTGTPPVQCQVGSEPLAIAVGDFNSDGIPDMVVVFNSSVGVMLGKGDGTFLPEVDYDTGSASRSVAIGDFDRDGSPDIAVGIDGGVAILLGNGDGTFQPMNDYSQATNGDLITVGDFNKDGILDLAIADESTYDVLLGVGDGTFQPGKQKSLDMNAGDGNIVATDFKGTGFLCDLAISGADGVEAFVGNGDGTFKAPQQLQPNAGFYPYIAGFTAADLNGDGIPDLALTWYSTDTGVGRVGVFYGNGDGTFKTTPKTLSVGQEPITIAAGDFAGNGSQDLVVGNYNDSTLSVILNSAANTATATLAHVSVPGSGTQQVFAQYQGDKAFGTSESTTIALTGSGVAGPVINSISPSTAIANSGALVLTVNGSGFATGAVVKWNGNARTTAFVSAIKLTAAILATDVATAGAYPITVTSGGATSNAVNFTVTSAANTPVLTSITPNYVLVGAAAFTLTANGSNFVAASAVYWNKTKLTTAYVSATKLTASVPAADVAALGSSSVTVVNPGNITSNALPFTVSQPTHTPLAYGFFSLTGSPGATSGNITCAWNTSEYLCTITGETFFYSKYVVNATIADTDTPAIVTVNSIGGNIIVKIFNLSGTAIQDPFYITVFKP